MPHVISDECTMCGACQEECPVECISEGDPKYKIDPDECTACGECVQRCQMDAVALEEDAPRFNLDRCIGCGVCVHLCPSGALTLQARPEFVEPPKNFRELMKKQFAPK